jgi:hypothetical protein
MEGGGAKGRNVHRFFETAIGADDDAKWLLDARLKNVWKRLDAWLAGIPEGWKETYRPMSLGRWPGQ